MLTKRCIKEVKKLANDLDLKIIARLSELSLRIFFHGGYKRVMKVFNNTIKNKVKHKIEIQRKEDIASYQNYMREKKAGKIYSYDEVVKELGLKSINKKKRRGKR
jgi:hypothetical protein